ncbi:hypothetical protein ABBQ38_004650 [Trebouxia sp. C0009 RCD-2024]
MQSVFSTPELLFHIAKRLPTQQDVCNLRATNMSAATGIKCLEASRFRLPDQPHISLEAQYNVIGEVRDGDDGSLLAKDFTYIRLCAAEQPAGIVRGVINVNVHDDTLRRLWLEHVHKQMPHPSLTFDTLQCTMYTGPGVTSDTAMQLLNMFIKEEVGWHGGKMIIVRKRDK